MAYTPPAGSAANLQLGSGYTVPAGNAADLSWYVTATEVIGNGAVTVEITAEGHGEHSLLSFTSSGAVTVDVTAAGLGAHGVASRGAASVGVEANGAGAHGVAGSGAASIDVTAAGFGQVIRYELSGEVRFQGVLVNRLVRAYRRDTGEMIGEMETVVGRFKLHAGFVAREHYLIPIDTAELADDWAPPVANRVLSVLAQDAA